MINIKITKEEILKNEEQNLAHSKGNKYYPSAPILLECIKNEYDKEMERMQSLDSKASFILSAIILIATIFIPIIPFSSIKEIVVNEKCINTIAVSVLFTLIIIATIIITLAIKHLYDAYQIKGYSRFDSINVVNQGNLNAESYIVETALCENYKNIVDSNIEINNKKAENISKGLKKSMIGFLLLSITTITLIVVVGKGM